MHIQEGLTDDEIVKRIAEWIQGYADHPLLLLVSGGSAAPIFANAWQNLSETQKKNVRLSLADERYGSPAHEMSNWQLLRQLGVEVDDQRHIPVLKSGLNITETAQEWDRQLEPFYLGQTMPIIGILGIGQDSHIAGIKPGSPATNDDGTIVCAYPWEDFERITITPQAIRQMQSVVVYANGTSKRTAIESLRKDLDSTQYPSQLLKQLPNCSVYYRP